MVWLTSRPVRLGAGGWLVTQGQTCWTCRACLAIVPLLTALGEALCVHCAGLSTRRERVAAPAAPSCLTGQWGARLSRYFCSSAEAKPLLLRCWQAWWLLCFLPPPYGGLLKSKTFTRSRSCESRLTRGGFAVSAWKEAWRRDPILAAAPLPCSFLLLLWHLIISGNCTERRQDLPAALPVPSGYLTSHTFHRTGQHTHHSFLSAAAPVSPGTYRGMWWKEADSSRQRPQEKAAWCQYLGAASSHQPPTLWAFPGSDPVRACRPWHFLHSYLEQSCLLVTLLLRWSHFFLTCAAPNVWREFKRMFGEGRWLLVAKGSCF